jgi:protein-tyrosine-phosphatase
MEKKQKVIILFLDTGDNCRCPMVKGYLQKLLDDRGIKHIEIRTAGVMTPSDLKPQDEAKQILAEEGVSIERHRSRPVSSAMIREADLILGMTPFHVQKALRESDEARQKTFLLKEYVGYEGKHTLIVDPMGGTLEVFKKVFTEIRVSLLKLINMPIIQNTRPAAPPPAPPAPRAAEKPQADEVTAPAKKSAPAKPAKPAAAKKAEPKKAAPAKKSVKPAVKKSAPKAKAAPKAAPAKAKAAPKAKAKPAPKPAAKKSAKPAVKKAAPKAKAAPARPAAKPAVKKAAPKAKPAKAAPKAPAKSKPTAKAKPASKAKTAPVKKGKK